VVPELASRNHSLALLPLVRTALENAGVEIADVDGFCATAGPGLASSLLIGHTAAKAMAVATGKSFVSVNHMEGHLLSPFITRENGVERNIALVISGGHTMIIENRGFGEYELVGKTLDDAAGEAFDKVAKMLQLPYPGGPEIESCAIGGDPKAYQFPRSMLKKPHFDFSFSGLKTAVLYTLSELDTDEGKPRDKDLPDLCASFQQAVIDVLVAKTMRAVKERKFTKLSISGGVSCNKALRSAFADACAETGVELLICSPHLSTDNAAMIGYVGLQKFIRGDFSDLSCDVNPNMPLNALKLR
jgi:N6-L-threonylcarbamoyladenine synthase